MNRLVFLVISLCLLCRLVAADAPAKSAKTVRLLTVGNSFSQNATRQLGSLVTNAGHVLIHQPIVVGGASLELHWGRAAAFEKDATSTNGLYSNKLSLKQMLSAQPWDFVTIQQASIKSHDATTYRPFAKQLHDYITQHAPKAEVLMHQTWAYRVDDPRFKVAAPKAGEPKTQAEMYQQLTRAYTTIAAELGIRRLPVGDAFYLADTDPKWGYQSDAKYDFTNKDQTALPDQTHSLHVGWRKAKGKDGQDTLGMDGHHANMAGEYLGACVWFEILFGESVVGNPFVTPGLDKTYAQFLQQTAHRAVIASAMRKLSSVSVTASAPDLTAQADADAKQDRTSIPYDGKTPNKLVCDTTLRQLSDGSWALFMLAGDDFEPSPQNYTGITRSTDHGKTWSPLEPMATGLPRSGLTTGQCVSEVMVRGGRVTAFLSTHSQTWGRDWKSWILYSDDGCKTWSRPEPAPGRLANFTFIRNHIVARDGRIIIPFQHYLGPPSGTPPPAPEEKPWHKSLFHYVSNPRNGVLISSDGGKTWSEHGNVRLTADDRYHGWAENNLAELADGRIAMIIRADRLGGVLYYAESKDGGRTWPEFAVKTDIPNPGSKATLYPLGGDTVAMLHNPNPSHRSPLAMWISFDGLKTWPYRRVLVPESCDGPKGRLNYPDGFVSADKQLLHFAFDDNRHRAVHYTAKLPPLP